MGDANNIREDQWIRQLASEYDGSLPYKNETDVILWLEKRAAGVKDVGERKRYKALIEEGRSFGGSDDWGVLDSNLVGFARLLQLLRSRLHDE